MSKTHESITDSGSALSKYQDVVVGSRSFWFFLYFEWCTWLAIIPGALGLFLRKLFLPRLFKSCGRGVVFGKNIVLRHPNRISLGNNVVISEDCVLDARNDDSDQAIMVADNVILSNNVMLSCKNGSIEIGNHVGINAQTIIQSTNHCPVKISPDVIIGQQCFVVAGGSYNTNRFDMPIRQQDIKNDGGVTIEEDVWLGGNVTVLGGVRLGKGSIAAAGAVITKSIPKMSKCRGVPAKVFKMRHDKNASN